MALNFLAGPDNIRWLSKSPFLCVFETDQDPAVDDCKLRVEVILSTDPNNPFGANFLASFKYIQRFNADKRVEFDFSALIDEWLGNRYTRPDSTINSRFDVVDGDVYVFAYVEELLNDVIVDDEMLHNYMGLPHAHQVFQGGLTYEAGNLGEYWNYRATISPTLPFCTWKNNSRITDKKFPTYLYYLLDDAFDFRLQLKVYNDTTLVLSEDVWTEAFNDKVVVFPTGWQDLSIQNRLNTIAYTGNVTHYTVQLFDDASGDPVSYEVKYYLDNKAYKNRTLLYYENGIMGFDEMRITGERVEKGEYTRVSGSMPFSLYGQQFIDGLSKTFSTSEQYTVKQYLQYMQAAEAQHLRALALAPRVFVRDQFDRVIPIELTEKSKEILNTGKFMQDNFIEYRMAFKNRVFTPPGVFIL